jgi:hypothetical protein
VAFLERINQAGGVAFVARDLRDVLREIESNPCKFSAKAKE